MAFGASDRWSRMSLRTNFLRLTWIDSTRHPGRALAPPTSNRGIWEPSRRIVLKSLRSWTMSTAALPRDQGQDTRACQVRATCITPSPTRTHQRMALASTTEGRLHYSASLSVGPLDEVTICVPGPHSTHCASVGTSLSNPAITADLTVSQAPERSSSSGSSERPTNSEVLA